METPLRLMVEKHDACARLKPQASSVGRTDQPRARASLKPRPRATPPPRAPRLAVAASRPAVRGSRPVSGRGCSSGAAPPPHVYLRARSVETGTSVFSSRSTRSTSGPAIEAMSARAPTAHDAPVAHEERLRPTSAVVEESRFHLLNEAGRRRAATVACRNSRTARGITKVRDE
jgi:hypothetical protein